MQTIRITLIGAGHLATRLGLALKGAGHEFVQVYSRTMESASTLASLLDAEATIEPLSIRPDAQLYICAVKDDALDSILKKLAIGSGVLVHTAGSLPLNILLSCSQKVGVFYPMQTFNKNKEVDFESIPIYIEAQNPEVANFLVALANQLSTKVQVVDGSKRLNLHIAAVFACNFVNHLYTISYDLMTQNQLHFSDLLPLIRETAEKLTTLTPDKAQTGPAVRMDKAVIDSHLEQLQAYPDWQNLYEILSQGIYKRQTLSEQ